MDSALRRDILNYFTGRSLTMYNFQTIAGNSGLHPNNFIQDNLQLYYWASKD
jgi:hypothetical protein